MKDELENKKEQIKKEEEFRYFQDKIDELEKERRKKGKLTNNFIKKECNNIFDNLGQEFDEYYEENYQQRMSSQQILKIKNIVKTSSDSRYYEELYFRGYLNFYQTDIQLYISFPGPDRRYNNKSFYLTKKSLCDFIIDFNQCYQKYKSLKGTIPDGGNYYEEYGYDLSIVFTKYNNGIKFNDYDTIKVFDDRTFIRQMADLKYAWDMLTKIYDYSIYKNINY